jgi:putative lipoprotein
VIEPLTNIKTLSTLALAAGTTLLLACSPDVGPGETGAANGGMETITGTVWYRERIALPPNAEITVDLEDVSRADVASDLIASVRMPAIGGPPYPFSIDYDPAWIDDRGRYNLRARIEVDGGLLFTSTESISPFDVDAGTSIEIMVARVGGQRNSATANLVDASLTNTYWTPLEINGELVTLGAGDRELNMVLMGDESRVRGYSGCNQFGGTYEVGTDDQLTFGALAATMMACAEGMEQEQLFLGVLGETRRFAIDGQSLALYDDEDAQILRFEAVHLR